MFSFFTLPAFAAAGSQTITVDGRLFSSLASDTPLIDSSVVMDIKIYNPAASCILYEEKQTVDTSSTDGRFTINVGSAVGASKRVSGEPGNPMTAIFQNAQPIAGSCGAYTPAAGDARLLRITIAPSTTGTVEVLSPDTIVDQVPNAFVAETLQGLSSTNFVQTDTASLTQANVANIFSATNYPLLTSLLGGTSSSYVTSSTNGAKIPTVAGVPASLAQGQIWFNSSANAFQYYNGSAVQTLGIAGSGIASLTVGSSLTAGGVSGGTLTTSGTIDLVNSGVTAGTYPKVTINSKGLVTYGTGLAEGDIPQLTTPGHVLGDAITSGTIGGSTAFYSSGNVTTTGTVSGAYVSSTYDMTRKLSIYGTGSTYAVSFMAPSMSSNYSVVLPASQGAAGTTLVNDGSGNLAWTSASSGSVSSVGLALPSIFSVTTPVVTSTGTLTATLASQNANMIFAGPASGAAGAPTFRGLAVADLPAGYDASVQKNSLASGQMWIGNSAGVAAAVTPFGDVIFSIAGSATVTQLQGRPVSATGPSAAGQVLRWSGGAWTPNFVAMTDLRSTITGNNSFQTSCAANQTLTYNSVGDMMSCSNIAIANTQVAWGSTGANLVFAGPATGGSAAPAFRALTAADLPSGIATQWNTVSTTINYLAGFVGIGTATPQATLDVYGTGAASAMLVPRDTSGARPTGVNGMIRYNTTSNAMETYSNGSWTTLATAAAGASQWITNGSMIYYGSGSVGIGSSSPSEALDVAGAIYSHPASFNYGNFWAADSTGTKRQIIGVSSSYLNSTVLQSAGGGILFRNSSAGPSMFLTEGGNLGIGTTGPGSTLSVYGTATVGPEISLQSTDVGGRQYKIISSASANTTGAGFFRIFDQTATADRFVISPAGFIGVGTNAPAASLDVFGTGANSAMLVPRDSVTARPTGVNGMLRYNTSSNVMETYSNGAWTTLATAAAGASQWTTSGSSIYYGSGSVGIGTASPAATLDVNGNLNVNNGISGLVFLNSPGAVQDSTQFVFRNGLNNEVLRVAPQSGTIANAIGIRGTVTGTNPSIFVEGSDTNIGLSLSTKGSSAIILQNGGNGFVGIGTSTPLALLDIYGVGTANSAMLVPRDSTAARPAGVNGMIRYNTTSGKLEAFTSSAWQSLDTSSGANGAFVNGGNAYGSGATLGTTDANSLGLITSGSTRMTIMASGNVAIGTSSATNLLQVGSASDAQNRFVDLYTSSGYTDGVNLFSSSPWYGFTIQNSDGSPQGLNILRHQNSLGGTSSLFIQRTTGYIGVGTTSPATLLDIEGSGNITLNAGTVGIGTNAANSALDVRGVVKSGPNNINAFDASSSAFVAENASGNSFVVAGQDNTHSLQLKWNYNATPSSAYGSVETFSGNNNIILGPNGGLIGIGTVGPQAALDIYSTGAYSALLVPRDSQANRPAGVSGMIRYNTTIGQLETYSSGAWAGLATGASVSGSYLPLAGGTLTGTVSHPLGSATAPSINFGDSTSGLYSTGSGNVAISTYGTARVLVQPSGFVGIGTASPSGTLDIAGTNGDVYFQNTGDTLNFTAPAGYIKASNASGTLALQTGGANTRLFIAASGAVGIGTNVPTGQFDVRTGGLMASTAYVVGKFSESSSVKGASIEYYTNSSGNAVQEARIRSTGNIPLALGTTSNPQKIYILDSGNVGIGNTNPTQALSVVSSPSVTSGLHDVASFMDGVYGIYGGWIADGTNVTAGYLKSSGSVPLRLGTSNTVASGGGITILDTNGNVGIGTTSPGSILDLAGYGTAQSAMIVPRDSTAARPSGVNGMLRYNTTTAQLESYSSGAWAGLATSAGVSGSYLPLAGGTLTGAVAYPAGSATAPSINFGDSTSGLYSTGSGNISFGTSNTSRLTISATGSVNASGQIAAAGPVLTNQNFLATSFGSYGTGAYSWSSDSGSGMFKPVSNAIAFANSGTEVMRISGSSVGIGTNAPNSTLDVLGTASGTQASILRLGPSDLGDAMVLGNNTNIATRVAPILVGQSNNSAYTGLMLTGRGPDSTGASGIPFVGFSAATGGTDPLTGTAGAVTNRNLFHFFNNTTVVMAIAANGNVGIGSTAPASILDLAGYGTAQSAMIVPRDSTTARPSGVNGMLRYNTTTAQLESYSSGAWAGLTTSAGVSGSYLPLAGGTLTGVVAHPAGSATAPSINFGDATSGLYSTGSGLVSVATSGLTRLTVNASGLVGIGTTNPVNGVDIATAGTDVRLMSTIDAGHGFQVTPTNGSTERAYLYTTGGNGNHAGHLRLTNGNSDTTFADITMRNAALTPIIYLANSGGSYFNGGSVGIGTTNPGSTLEVRSGQNDGVLGFTLTDNENSSTLASLGQISGGSIGWNFTGGAGELNFFNRASAGSQRGFSFLQQTGTGTFNTMMTISGTSGYVGIGTFTAAALLDVNGTGAASAILVPRDSTGARPTGINGMLRYNTTTAQLETYSSGAWAGLATSAAVSGSYLPLSGGTLTGVVAYPTGSVAAPALNFGDAATGFYTTGTANLSAAVSGVNKMTINSVGVGIGTTSPGALLGVNPVGLGGANLATSAIFGSASGLAGAAGAYLYPFEVQANSGNNLRLQFAPYRRSGTGGWNGTAYRMQYAVDSSFTTGTKSLIEVGASDPAVASGGFISLATEGTDRLVVNSSGNVGIGTTIPTVPLQIGSNQNAAMFNFGPNINSGNSYQMSLMGNPDPFGAYTAKLVGARDSGSGYSSYLGFYTESKTAANMTDTSTEKMRLTQYGYLGIGTTNPQGALDVYGTGVASAMLVPRDTTANRPTGVNGMIRYNTTNAQIETFANNVWAPLAVGSPVSSQWTTSGANIYYGTGNVGIGTASPGSALDMKGALRLEGATSGYAGLQAPATAGSVTWTLPSADGTSGQALTTNGAGVLGWSTVGSGAASTGVAFSVNNANTNMTVTASTATPLVFSNKVYDSNSNYSTSNGRFTPSVAGYYLFHANVYCTDNTNWCQARLYKNGSAELSESGVNTTANLAESSTVAITYMNGTSDYVQAFAYNGGGTTIGGGNGNTFFDGALVAPISGGSVFSALLGAVATNTIDNTTYAQNWNWSTATTQNPLSIAANALTTGSELSLTSSSSSLNSTNGLLYVANTSTSTSGLTARFQSNSTAGAGLTVTNAGNVGIGTASPQAVLDVNGLTSASAMLVPRDTTANRPTGINGMLRYNTTNAQLETFANSAWTPLAGSGSSQWTTNGANIYFNSSSGNVGVGIASPSISYSSPGQIVQTGGFLSSQRSGDVGYHMYNGGAVTEWLIRQPSHSTDDMLHFSRLVSGTSTDAMTINTTGQVGTNGALGVGVTNPSYLLDINTGTSNNVRLNSGGSAPDGFMTAAYGNFLFSNNLVYNGGWTLEKAGTGSQVQAGQSSIAFNTVVSGSAGASVTPVTQMQIGIDGRVGIGTTSPVSVLDVFATGTYSAMVVPRDTTANRPTGTNGMIRYNTTTSQLETYSSGAWAGVATAASTVAGTGTAGYIPVWSNSTTLANSPIAVASSNVGIGTATPGFPLEVAGRTALTTLVGRTTSQVANDTLFLGGSGGNFFIDKTGGGQVIHGYNTPKGSAVSGVFQVYDNSTDKNILLQLNSAGTSSGSDGVVMVPYGGYVGIGTTAPDVPLEVSANTSGNQAPDTYQGNTNFHIAGANSANSRMLMDAFGTGYFNVIAMRAARGTSSSPSAVQNGDVLGKIQATGYGASSYSGGVAEIMFSAAENWTDSSHASSMTLGTTPTGSTSTTARVYIDPTGRVGFGTTSPAYVVDVVGSVNVGSSNYFKIGGTNICSSSGCTSSSDRTLKKNILPLQDSLDKITQLQGVSYDWKDKKRFSAQHQVGLIAQDVEKVYPEVVVKDPDSGIRSIAYDHMVGPIVEAIKELLAKLLDHDARIKSLEEENLKLKGQAEFASKDAAAKAEELKALKERMDRLEKLIDKK